MRWILYVITFVILDGIVSQMPAGSIFPSQNIKDTCNNKNNKIISKSLSQSLIVILDLTKVLKFSSAFLAPKEGLR